MAASSEQSETNVLAQSLDGLPFGCREPGTHRNSPIVILNRVGGSDRYQIVRLCTQGRSWALVDSLCGLVIETNLWRWEALILRGAYEFREPLHY
jgi:hypothetical protein